jgi:hypothetical protein
LVASKIDFASEMLSAPPEYINITFMEEFSASIRLVFNNRNIVWFIGVIISSDYSHGEVSYKIIIAYIAARSAEIQERKERMARKQFSRLLEKYQPNTW